MALVRKPKCGLSLLVLRLGSVAFWMSILKVIQTFLEIKPGPQEGTEGRRSSCRRLEFRFLWIIVQLAMKTFAK